MARPRCTATRGDEREASTASQELAQRAGAAICACFTWQGFSRQSAWPARTLPLGKIMSAHLVGPQTRLLGGHKRARVGERGRGGVGGHVRRRARRRAGAVCEGGRPRAARRCQRCFICSRLRRSSEGPRVGDPASRRLGFAIRAARREARVAAARLRARAARAAQVLFLCCQSSALAAGDWDFSPTLRP